MAAIAKNKDFSLRTAAGRGMTLPASMRRAPVRGHCRWCDLPIAREDGGPDLRRTWHPDCARHYRICTIPREARRALRKRDRSRCRDCGKKVNSSDSPWEAHHEFPLWKAGGDPKYYGLENQVILCVPCHLVVSLRDARERLQMVSVTP
jgi:hypothetical protein